jgi:hypothetical protein
LFFDGSWNKASCFWLICILAICHLPKNINVFCVSANFYSVSYIVCFLLNIFSHLNDQCLFYVEGFPSESGDCWMSIHINTQDLRLVFRVCVCRIFHWWPPLTETWWWGSLFRVGPQVAFFAAAHGKIPALPLWRTQAWPSSQWGRGWIIIVSPDFPFLLTASRKPHFCSLLCLKWLQSEPFWFIISRENLPALCKQEAEEGREQSSGCLVKGGHVGT